jgi:general secretion pathway protein A
MLDFGIAEVPASKAQRLWALQGFLLDAYRAQQVAILAIDEAHKLSADVLEEIRLLGNYEYGPDKFLQIVLLGQCELDELLDRHDLRQFKQRVALRLYIDPLSAEETAEYIRFRWAKAGGAAAPPFTPEAIEGVVKWSGGNPRLINSICDWALLMAFGDSCSSVGVQYIRDAAMNLSLVPAPVFRAASATPTAHSGSGNHGRPVPTPGSVDLPLRQGAGVPPFATDAGIPTWAPYGSTRENPSILRRLAGKFGFPQ